MVTSPSARTFRCAASCRDVCRPEGATFFLPATDVGRRWLQPALVAEARIFWSQSLLKWLISYGEGLLLKLAAPELRSQDLYASVVNLGTGANQGIRLPLIPLLGSLVVRSVFLPVEDIVSAYAYLR
jgi:hypothetical protein